MNITMIREYIMEEKFNTSEKNTFNIYWEDNGTKDDRNTPVTEVKGMQTYGEWLKEKEEQETLDMLNRDNDYEPVDEMMENLHWQYPNLTEEFLGVCINNVDLFAAKMLSYGLENIALGTSMDEESDRKRSLDGVIIRMMDKMSRLKRLVLENKDNTVATESIEDTLADLANYSVIAHLVLNDKWRK